MLWFGGISRARDVAGSKGRRVGPRAEVGPGNLRHYHRAGVELVVHAARVVIRASLCRTTEKEVVESRIRISGRVRSRIIGLYLCGDGVYPVLGNTVARKWRTEILSGTVRIRASRAWVVKDHQLARVR